MTIAGIAALADLALAAGLGVLRSVNGSAGQSHAEGLLPTVAFALLLAAPGLLVLTGVAVKRPALFIAAALACVPLAIISIAAVPIWLPAAGFAVAFARTPRSRRWIVTDSIILVGFPALLLVALSILVAVHGQYTYTYPGGSEGGDYVLPSRAAWTIVVIVADLAVATILAAWTGDKSTVGAT